MLPHLFLGLLPLVGIAVPIPGLETHHRFGGLRNLGLRVSIYCDFYMFYILYRYIIFIYIYYIMYIYILCIYIVSHYSHIFYILIYVFFGREGSCVARLFERTD